MQLIKNAIGLLFTALPVILNGCTKIQPVGQMGPKNLQVYSIAHDDFLTSSRMIVILDKKGNLLASSGGTVAGGGTVGLQTGSTLASAGAILYGAKAVQQGLQHAGVNVKGIPSSVDVNHNVNIGGSGIFGGK